MLSMMLAQVSPESLLNGHGTLVLALVVASLSAGFLAGLLGIGGGGILVPILYEAFGIAGVPEDVRMHITLGTTLAVIAPTGIRSFLAHYSRGTVDKVAVKRMAPPIIIGVIIGVAVADYASSAELRWVWVVFSLALAIKLLFGRDDWVIAHELPRPPVLEFISVLIGLLSAIMGIGGATFTVPLLSFYGRKVLTAVSTASAFNPVIAVPGLIGYIIAGWGTPGLPPFSLGYVSLGALVIAPLSVFAAPYGVHVAHNIDKRKLEIGFAAFLILVCVRFLMTLF